MSYFHRINVSEGTDVNKTSESKECNCFHYRYFLDKGYRFPSDVMTCNGCHDVLMMPMNLSDIAILNIHGTGYFSIISNNSNKT